MSSYSEYSSDKVITKALEEVMHDSMLPYSEFVILDRALPRVEDGLKPVQRRVLYSMLELGVLPDRPYRKSARIVGDCMGKYHPHGDSSIYQTMVRMAQDFNMGEVLVDGHGNFGSVDGDGAAAMRYTEAKLAPIALELLKDIEKNTVSWSFNFDDTCKEPDMLPGRFPNLLVNGATGIAVGLATNIPTHNLKEACNAVATYIDNPKCTLDDIMKVMPAPDFPTGGYIVESSEIRQAYETGKGKIIMRAKLHIENVENGKKNIVITEIPYQVNKATLLQRIAKLKEDCEPNSLLSFVSEIVDESDRFGTRAVVKLKKDARVNAIIQYLYKNTDLELAFNVNMVAIADGKPKQLSLLEIISYYTAYQQQVIYNRTKYDLEACLKKEHILEGLLIAINNIDQVIAIIKTSKNVTDAKIKLMSTFSLTDVQAQAILDMRLSRLTSLEVEKLVTELNRLKDLIARYTEILKSPKLQLKIVKKEILEIAESYGTPRKCEFIQSNDSSFDDDNNTLTCVEEESAEDVYVIYSPYNTLKTVTTKSYNLATKTLSSEPSLYEIPSICLKVKSNANVYAFTNMGNCIKLDVSKINSAKYKDKGAFITSFSKLIGQDEKIVNILELNDTNKDNTLIFVTRNGMVKLSSISEYLVSKQVVQAIKLKDDELLYVGFNQDNKYLSLFSKNGMNLTFDKSEITPSGRVSVGVKGINLDTLDKLVGAMQISNDESCVVLLDNGNGKNLKYSELCIGARNRKGLSVIKSGTKLVCAYLNNLNTNYVLEKGGELIYVENSHIPFDKRTGSGKPVITSKGTISNCYKYVIL